MRVRGRATVPRKALHRRKGRIRGCHSAPPHTSHHFARGHKLCLKQFLIFFKKMDE